MGRGMKNKIKNIFKILVVTAGCFMFASFSPSLDGRAVVVDSGVFPQGLFAKTVGYLPGDIITVTNIAGDSTVDLLVIGALDPSEGVAIMLSPEAAEAMGIEKGSNNIVKITKRSGQDERVYGNAVISKSETEINDEADDSFDSIGEEENTEAFEDTEENSDFEETEETEVPEETEEVPLESEIEDEAIPSEVETESDLADEEDEFTEEEAFVEEELEEDFEEEGEEEVEIEPSEELAEDEAEVEEEEFVDELPEVLEENEEEAFTEEALDELPVEEELEETVEESPELEENPVEEELPAEEDFSEEELADDKLQEIPVEEENPEEFKEESYNPEEPASLPSEEQPAEEEPAEEFILADELDALPEETEPAPEEAEETLIEEGLAESEESETEEYEAIVLVPVDSNPPEISEDEVEDVAPVDELAPIDEIFEETPAPAPLEAAEVKTPETRTSYDKYIVPSLKELESGKYYIQIAVYTTDENILEIINKYGNNYPVTIVPMATGIRKQVLIGPLTMDEYAVVLERFKSYGFKDAFLRKVR